MEQEGAAPTRDRRCWVPPGRLDLGSGRVLEIRAVTAGDVDGLAALYDGLGAEDRHLRFFSSYRPPRQFFERMATVGDRGGFGLVAVAGPDGPARPIVAQAEYHLLPNGDGELGMAVAREWRGWLGPYLLAELTEAAAARGVPNLEADVLVGNAPMLAALRARGAANLRHPDWTVVRVIMGTTGSAPSWPGPRERQRVLVEAPGGGWNAEEAARQAGLDVVMCPGPGRRRVPCPALTGGRCPLAEGADAIVVCHEPGPDPGRTEPVDELWEELMRAHARDRPGMPVIMSAPGLPARRALLLVEEALARRRRPPETTVRPGGEHGSDGRFPGSTEDLGP